MEFSSAIYRGDPFPEFSFSFKFVKYVKKYTDCKISDHWISGDAEKTAGPDLGGRI